MRFAPSPTGALHVGGARTTLYNWLFARRHGGTFILRIEDTDEVRSTRESVEAILESLAWLGLDWDEGPVPGSDGGEGAWREKGDFGPYFQMKRSAGYREALERLVAAGKAYPCYCSPEELDAMRRRAQLEKRPPRYDGRCRDLARERAAALEAQGRRPVLRFRMPDTGATEVPDLVRGTVRFENALLQDFVIQKATGGPAYNFACVVDDHLMRITHVIRGDEHLSNTPSQLQLYAALGWEPPAFAHLSMILGPDGSKLSKRHGAASVLDYRDQGYLPETMRNFLALLGWSTAESQQLFEPGELEEKFDLDRCQKSPATFDPAKLSWMNGAYIRKLSGERLAEAAAPFLAAAGLGAAPRERLTAALRLEQQKMKLLREAPRLVDFFFKPVEYEPKAVEKVLRAPGAAGVLEGLGPVLAGVSPFAEKAIEAAVRGFCESRGLKAAAAFHPLRVAVSGRAEGPTLFGMLELLGREAVLERLRSARLLAARA